MTVYRVALTDSREVDLNGDEALGVGGEKTAFRSTNRRHVALFFGAHVEERQERLKQIERLLHRHNPTSGPQTDYWKAHFRWPEGIIDGDGGLPDDFLRRNQLLRPAAGVLVPAIEPHFYFQTAGGEQRLKCTSWYSGGKSRRLLPAAERGDLAGLVQCCAMLCRAVRRLHHSGLAHGDLSGKNVIIDPRSRQTCIIDLDSLAIPGQTPSRIFGTNGYMAPEVLGGRSRSFIEADLHALAVLIYELLLGRHPLAGPKKRSEDPDECERLGFGEEALFIEHPTDRSNRLPVPPLIPYTRLGSHLAALFRRAFVEELHQPARRPTAEEWEKALYRTADLLVPTPDGQEWMVVEPGLPMTDPWTRRPLAEPVPFARFHRRSRQSQQFVAEPSGHGLAIYHGLRLMPWHLAAGQPDETAIPASQGYFVCEKGTWYLVNESDEVMQTGAGRTLRRNDFVVLEEGLVLTMSEDPAARQMRFTFLSATRPS